MRMVTAQASGAVAAGTGVWGCFLNFARRTLSPRRTGQISVIGPEDLYAKAWSPWSRPCNPTVCRRAA